MTPAIRLATLDDLDQAAELAMALGDSTNSDPATWKTALRDDIEQPSRCLFVAGTGTTLVGEGRIRHFQPPPGSPVNIAPAGYYLMGLGVLPAARRQGIGRRLTLARIAWAAACTDKLWFFTEAANHPSLALHTSLGFREVTRDFTYPGFTFPPGGAVLCVLSLTQNHPRQEHADPARNYPIP
jgi:ribosomal protein S18 acetylase RimI-like enzyme